MGEILRKQNVANGKVKCSLILDIKETLLLQGNLKNVHLFSSNSCKIKTEIMETGINYSTKYFKIPEELKNPLKKVKRKYFRNKVLISCLKIDAKDKNIFVYIIDTNKMI